MFFILIHFLASSDVSLVERTATVARRGLFEVDCKVPVEHGQLQGLAEGSFRFGVGVGQVCIARNPDDPRNVLALERIANSIESARMLVSTLSRFVLKLV